MKGKDEEDKLPQEFIRTVLLTTKGDLCFGESNAKFYQRSDHAVDFSGASFDISDDYEDYFDQVGYDLDEIDLDTEGNMNKYIPYGVSLSNGFVFKVDLKNFRKLSDDDFIEVHTFIPKNYDVLYEAFRESDEDEVEKALIKVAFDKTGYTIEKFYLNVKELKEALPKKFEVLYINLLMYAMYDYGFHY